GVTRGLAVRVDLGERVPGLVGTPPALGLVVAAAQRVHNAVQVGADPQTVEGDVVTGVADDGDVGVGHGGEHAAQETGGADPARQNGDSHGSSLSRTSTPPPSASGAVPPPATVTPLSPRDTAFAT